VKEAIYQGATLTGSESGAVDGVAPDKSSVVSVEAAYELRGEHARGGLGRVLKAEDRRLGRLVAIKELLRSGTEEARRFLREVHLTARLQHPGVVPVYEAGRWPDGTPFYVMKFVDGRTLKDVLRDAKTLEERLALLPKIIAIAETMAYVHSERVIHRDLKPSNVLIGPFGETVIVDWGLAKDLNDSGRDEVSTGPYRATAADGTLEGTVLGTPAYMAPEQARGESVDERADVYAIGAMLYELLSGRAPYGGSTGPRVVAQVVMGAPPPLRQRARDAPHDLVAIVEKAMARDPARRYRNAGDFADDLKRFQTGQLVGARQYSAGAILHRWVARHRGLVVLSALFTAFIVVGTVISFRRVLRERNRAESARDLLLLKQARSWLDRDPTTAAAWLKRYLEHGADIGAAQEVASEVLERGAAHLVLDGHSTDVFGVAYVPNAELIASASTDKSLRFWNARSGQEIRTVWARDELYSLAASSRGEIAAAGVTGPILMIDPATGAQSLLRGHSDFIMSLVFTQDGGVLASSSCDDTIRLWDRRNGKVQVLRFHQPRMSNIAFTKSGDTLAAGGSRGEVRLFDAQRGTFRDVSGAKGEVNAVAFSDDDRFLLAAGEDGTARLWDLHSGKLIEERAIGAAIPLVAFVPGRASYAAVGADRVIRVWEVGKREASSVLHGHEAPISALALSRDGKTLASGDDHGVVRAWDVGNGESQVFLGQLHTITALDFSPDGTELVSSSTDHTIRVWPVPAAPRVLQGHHGRIYDVGFTSDGNHLATVGLDYTARVWDPSGRELATLQHDNVVYAMDLLRSGELVTASYDKFVRLWTVDGHLRTKVQTDIASPRTVKAAPDGGAIAVGGLLPDGQAAVRVYGLDGTEAGRVSVKEDLHALAWSPDGGALAIGDGSGNVVLWTRESRPHTIRHQSGAIWAVAFDPSGKHIAAVGDSGDVTLTDIATGQDRTLGRHNGRIYALKFASDGTLVTAGTDGDLRWWAIDGTHRGVLAHVEGRLLNVATSQDGALVAAGTAKGDVHLWRRATGDSLTLSAGTREVAAVRFSPDSSTIAAANADGVVHLWSTNEPMIARDREWLRHWSSSIGVGLHSEPLD
jgi:WD40 repeat protein